MTTNVVETESTRAVVTEDPITNIVEVTSAGPAGPAGAPGGSLNIEDNGVDEGLLTGTINFSGSTISVNNDTVNEIATVTVNAATPGANTNITSLGGITGGISSPDFIQFDTAAAATGAVGKLLWNDTDGTLEFQMKGGNATLQIGQEEVIRVTNQSGSAMVDGQVVYITGSTGNHLNVTLAQANSEATSSKTIAVVTEPIANNQSGFATSSGLVRNLNTSALTEGAAVWLSPTVPGGLTSTKPVAPDHAVLVGWCVKQHASVGVLYVHIANGYELQELHNVLITSVQDKQVIRYDSATSLWNNVTLSPTLTLSGDASGSATFTDLGNATLSVTVADNSHNHTIANVTNLQTSLDAKAPLASPTFTGTVTLPSTTSVGTVSSTEIGYLDGVTSAIQTQLDSKLSASGTLGVANGGTGATTAGQARTNLGATVVGSNLFTLTNPSAITFPRINADNTISALDAATFRTAIGAGTGNGTVTSVGGTGTVNGITLTGSVASSGNLTLGGTLSNVSLTTQVTGTLPVSNGGTGQTTYTDGQILIGNSTGNTLTKSTLTAGSGITITNGAGSITIAATGGGGGGSGTVTDVDVSGGSTGLTFTGGPVTTSGIITMSGVLAVTNGGTGTDVDFTPGSVVFAGASGVYAQEPSYFFWDDSNNRLGLGNNIPEYTLDVTGSGRIDCLRGLSASTASGSTITPISDVTNQYNVTALAVAATIAAPTGTPVDGQKLTIRIKDDGTARALTWTTGSGGSFREVGAVLPTTTVANKTVYVGCIYNSADLRWDVVAVSQEA